MTKRAFTLVELLVVVGIMAAMATMSIGSYFAVVRGMADRGALASATSVISLAQERARIDLSPTVVYFYNELIQAEDKQKGVLPVSAGVAVAVRRAGRIARVTGNLLCDEFADLNITYGVADGSGSMRGDTFRLYKFNFQKMEYSSVFSEAVVDRIGGETYLVETPQNRNFRTETGESEDPMEMLVYAFERTGGNANWEVGSAYGYEFARIRLPDNYIFGSPSKEPTESNPIIEVDAIPCYPDSSASTLKSIEVYARRPSGWASIGETKDEMKDI